MFRIQIIGTNGTKICFEFLNYRNYIINQKMDRESAEYKKQALQLIISIYLNRKTDEDIKFLHENIKSTDQLVKDIGSSLQYGLDKISLFKNQQLYGQNQKKNTNGPRILPIICSETQTCAFILAVILCFLMIIVGGTLKLNQSILDGIWCLIYILLASTIRIIVSFVIQYQINKFFIEQNNNCCYRVLRDGDFVEINQNKLCTGDIVELYHKDRIPASGILISSKDISLNEEIFGNKVQKKMSLESCCQHIKSMNIHQLKMAYQMNQLPSPVLVRDTEVVYGAGRLLVLTLDEQQLINKHRIIKKSKIGEPKIEQWAKRLTDSLQLINRIIVVFMGIYFILIYSLDKWLQRQDLIFQKTFYEIIHILFRIVLVYLLLDKKTIALFLRVRLLKFLMHIKNPEQMKQVLTAQQILITQQNIVRYDQVEISHVGSFEKRQAIPTYEFTTLSDSQQKIINQVIEGVMLKPIENQLKSKQKDQKQKSRIIQSYKAYHKIVTCFDDLSSQLSQQYENSNAKNNSIQQNNSKMDLLSSIINNSSVNNQKCTFLHPSYQNQQPAKQPENSDLSRNEQELVSMIQENCKFTPTTKIVRGIMQIAQKQCTTYYYTKFTTQDLKKIKYIYLNGEKIQMNRENREKMNIIGKKLANDNLIPIMIGYSEGFKRQKNMEILVGMLGVKVNCFNQAIDQMKKLEDIGIKCLILIYHEGQQKQTCLTDLTQQYQGRQWLQFKQGVIFNMKKIRKACGRLVCGACLIANCDCKDRKEEVSNPFKFVEILNTCRIIYGVNSEADSYYLQCALQQIREQYLSITQQQANTLQYLNNIFEGYRFIEGVARGILYFCGFNIIICIALLFYKNVLFNRQMMALIIFGIAIPLIGFISNLTMNITKSVKPNRKNIIIFPRQYCLTIIYLTFIVGAMLCIIYFYPYFIPQQNSQQIQHLLSQGIINSNCRYIVSDYVVPAYAPYQCKNSSASFNLKDNVLIYSRHSTFIFNYLFLVLWLYYIMSYGNWLNIRTILTYLSIFLLQMIGLYLVQSSLQSYVNGLDFIQYIISFSMALGTVLLSFILGTLTGYFTQFLNPQLQSELQYDENSRHYSNSIKKYLSYSDDFVFIRSEQF